MAYGTGQESVGKGKSIFITHAAPKTRRSYDYVREGRPGNPTSIHKKNYVVVDKFHVSEEFLSRLFSGDGGTINDLEERVRSLGLSGVFIVQQNRGGGRRPSFIDDGTWHSICANRGAREIARITIDADEGDDDEGGYIIID